MLPANSHNFSPEIHKSNKPKTLNFLKSTLNSIQTYFSSHPRFWLFITFLLIQALVIFIARTPPPSLPAEYTAISASENHFPTQTTIVCNNTQRESEKKPLSDTEECGTGKIFVYDLPYMFNKDLVLANCTDLNPWNWQCGIFPNHGYGSAATELTGILPGTLSSSWYRTNQFSLEPIFHHRMLHHKCRTLEPESATAFYIPFYAGLAVGKFLWGNDTSKRDWHCRMMIQWVKKQKSWQRSNGSDHFMAVGRITWDFRRLTDPGKLWGSSFLNMPEMQQVTRFTIEKAPGDYYDNSVCSRGGIVLRGGRFLTAWWPVRFPFFFWKRTAYDQYEWFLPSDPKSYSVFIDHEDVRNGTSIKEVLMRYSKQEIMRKRENLIETIPRIIYAKPNKGLGSFRDAFDIAVDEVLRRIKLEKEWADFVG
ncbi:glycosyltransferase 18 [Abeliophyllum distichum]|uniref:Glycosyltransferase 18 n=1 Tax=Abeliophyllum distichum TaxID=126358 RepID=A0ABD1SGM0_9LAMI